MVLYIMKWDIHPDKAEAYLKWTGSAVKRSAVPGVVEFRAYRPASGSSQIAVTYEFFRYGSLGHLAGQRGYPKSTDRTPYTRP